MQKLGRLTHAHLEKIGACYWQRHTFRRVFPRGFVPSERNFIKAANHELNIFWALGRIVSSRLADKIHRAANERRWGPQQMWQFESLSHSVGHEWWKLIKSQIQK